MADRPESEPSDLGGYNPAMDFSRPLSELQEMWEEQDRVSEPDEAVVLEKERVLAEDKASAAEASDAAVEGVLGEADVVTSGKALEGVSGGMAGIIAGIKHSIANVEQMVGGQQAGPADPDEPAPSVMPSSETTPEDVAAYDMESATRRPRRFPYVKPLFIHQSKVGEAPTKDHMMGKGIIHDEPSWPDTNMPGSSVQGAWSPDHNGYLSPGDFERYDDYRTQEAMMPSAVEMADNYVAQGEMAMQLALKGPKILDHVTGLKFFNPKALGFDIDEGTLRAAIEERKAISESEWGSKGETGLYGIRLDEQAKGRARRKEILTQLEANHTRGADAAEDIPLLKEFATSLVRETTLIRPRWQYLEQTKGVTDPSAWFEEFLGSREPEKVMTVKETKTTTAPMGTLLGGPWGGSAAVREISETEKELTDASEEDATIALLEREMKHLWHRGAIGKDQYDMARRQAKDLVQYTLEVKPHDIILGMPDLHEDPVGAILSFGAFLVTILPSMVFSEVIALYADVFHGGATVYGEPSAPQFRQEANLQEAKHVAGILHNPGKTLTEGNVEKFMTALFEEGNGEEVDWQIPSGTLGMFGILDKVGRITVRNGGLGAAEMRPSDTLEALLPENLARAKENIDGHMKDRLHVGIHGEVLEFDSIWKDRQFLPVVANIPRAWNPSMGYIDVAYSGWKNEKGTAYEEAENIWEATSDGRNPEMWPEGAPSDVRLTGIEVGIPDIYGVERDKWYVPRPGQPKGIENISELADWISFDRTIKVVEDGGLGSEMQKGNRPQIASALLHTLWKTNSPEFVSVLADQTLNLSKQVFIGMPAEILASSTILGDWIPYSDELFSFFKSEFPHLEGYDSFNEYAQHKWEREPHILLFDLWIMGAIGWKTLGRRAVNAVGSKRNWAAAGESLLNLQKLASKYNPKMTKAEKQRIMDEMKAETKIYEDSLNPPKVSDLAKEAVSDIHKHGQITSTEFRGGNQVKTELVDKPKTVGEQVVPPGGGGKLRVVSQLEADVIRRRIELTGEKLVPLEAGQKILDRTIPDTAPKIVPLPMKQAAIDAGKTEMPSVAAGEAPKPPTSKDLLDATRGIHERAGRLADQIDAIRPTKINSFTDPIEYKNSISDAVDRLGGLFPSGGPVYDSIRSKLSELMEWVDKPGRVKESLPERFAEDGVPRSAFRVDPLEAQAWDYKLASLAKEARKSAKGASDSVWEAGGHLQDRAVRGTKLHRIADKLQEKLDKARDQIDGIPDPKTRKALLKKKDALADKLVKARDAANEQWPREPLKPIEVKDIPPDKRITIDNSVESQMAAHEGRLAEMQAKLEEATASGDKALIESTTTEIVSRKLLMAGIREALHPKDPVKITERFDQSDRINQLHKEQIHEAVVSNLDTFFNEVRLAPAAKTKGKKTKSQLLGTGKAELARVQGLIASLLGYSGRTKRANYIKETAESQRARDLAAMGVDNPHVYRALLNSGGKKLSAKKKKEIAELVFHGRMSLRSKAISAIEDSLSKLAELKGVSVSEWIAGNRRENVAWRMAQNGVREPSAYAMLKLSDADITKYSDMAAGKPPKVTIVRREQGDAAEAMNMDVPVLKKPYADVAYNRDSRLINDFFARRFLTTHTLDAWRGRTTSQLVPSAQKIYAVGEFMAHPFAVVNVPAHFRDTIIYLMAKHGGSKRTINRVFDAIGQTFLNTSGKMGPDFHYTLRRFRSAVDTASQKTQALLRAYSKRTSVWDDMKDIHEILEAAEIAGGEAAYRGGLKSNGSYIADAAFNDMAQRAAHSMVENFKFEWTRPDGTTELVSFDFAETKFKIHTEVGYEWLTREQLQFMANELGILKEAIYGGIENVQVVPKEGYAWADLTHNQKTLLLIANGNLRPIRLEIWDLLTQYNISKDALRLQIENPHQNVLWKDGKIAYSFENSAKGEVQARALQEKVGGEIQAEYHAASVAKHNELIAAAAREEAAGRKTGADDLKAEAGNIQLQDVASVKGAHLRNDFHGDGILRSTSWVSDFFDGQFGFDFLVDMYRNAKQGKVTESQFAEALESYDLLYAKVIPITKGLLARKRQLQDQIAAKKKQAKDKGWSEERLEEELYGATPEGMAIAARVKAKKAKKGKKGKKEEVEEIPLPKKEVAVPPGGRPPLGPAAMLYDLTRASGILEFYKGKPQSPTQATKVAIPAHIERFHRLRKWGHLTLEEKLAHGLFDFREAAALTMQGLSKNLAVSRMLVWLRENGLARTQGEVTSAGLEAPLGKNVKKTGLSFEMVPDDPLYRWGDEIPKGLMLESRTVKYLKEIHVVGEVLSGSSDGSFMGVVGKTYKAALGAWKVGQVARFLGGTMMRAIIGNGLILGKMAQIPYKHKYVRRYMADAMHFRRTGVLRGIYKETRDQGHGGATISHETNVVPDEFLRWQMDTMNIDGKFWDTVDNIGDLSRDRVKNLVDMFDQGFAKGSYDKLHDFISLDQMKSPLRTGKMDRELKAGFHRYGAEGFRKIYDFQRKSFGGIDDLYKGSYVYQLVLDHGWTVKDAIRMADRVFMDYIDVAPIIGFIRQTPWALAEPFVTFQLKWQFLSNEFVATNSLKAAGWYHLSQALNKATLDTLNLPYETEELNRAARGREYKQIMPLVTYDKNTSRSYATTPAEAERDSMKIGHLELDLSTVIEGWAPSLPGMFPSKIMEAGQLSWMEGTSLSPIKWKKGEWLPTVDSWKDLTRNFFRTFLMSGGLGTAIHDNLNLQERHDAKDPYGGVIDQMTITKGLLTLAWEGTHNAIGNFRDIASIWSAITGKEIMGKETNKTLVASRILGMSSSIADPHRIRRMYGDRVYRLILPYARQKAYGMRLFIDPGLLSNAGDDPAFTLINNHLRMGGAEMGIYRILQGSIPLQKKYLNDSIKSLWNYRVAYNSMIKDGELYDYHQLLIDSGILDKDWDLTEGAGLNTGIDFRLVPKNDNTYDLISKWGKHRKRTEWDREADNRNPGKPHESIFQNYLMTEGSEDPILMDKIHIPEEGYEEKRPEDRRDGAYDIRMPGRIPAHLKQPID